ncbi:Hydrogenase expression/formation protein HypD [Fundidesulfovibrio magnetotacticus]|uniref:Hydrogenase expression/formation protein HypD n=1 Tax=Fundidesulfovibrio magnetotacticus TaxID=2730080 RepID=A0A6V8M0R6_9BACT|nr:hydrogenase formation protein HypD [Fundidesulfovibrio magnetotacticus]GFK96048.1 Hydrogenase expression/formation protein HypD [Fundidesulfovibrio magnetotacticus]
MSSSDPLRDPALCREVLGRIEEALQGRSLRFMEVCGTHTVALFRSGVHSLLPSQVVHLTGPGCPVCVTHESEVAAYLELAGRDGVVIATFGDLMRVPGPGGASLKQAVAEGARVEVVYSPFDALAVAKANPGDKVVFLGIGFETTAPTVAATLRVAKAEGLSNFLVMPFHKLVPPALDVLLADPEMSVEGFMLPGHVSAIIGTAPYAPLAEKYRIPSVVAGFEPLDLLQAILLMAEMKRQDKPRVVNNYKRVVSDEGNPTARAIVEEVYRPCDALWRGIGSIPGSGLAMADAYKAHDAFEVLGVELRESPPLPGCRCGEVLKGKMPPDKCPLFAKACTPANPVGPCMVSTEGSCAAYFKYQLDLA